MDGLFKILVAEDNEVNQKVLSLILGKTGYAFEFVSDGQQAVERMEQARFDLVLMDCQMPHLDGLEATSRIRAFEDVAKRGRTPIVAITANAMLGDREKCLDAGMDDFLAKPFKVEDILQKINIWIKPRGVQ